MTITGTAIRKTEPHQKYSRRTPPTSGPIAPPTEDADGSAGEQASEGTPVKRDSGTLFERMSNIARGAPKAQIDDEDSAPDFRREPIDIPRFLNRQNNQ